MTDCDRTVEEIDEYLSGEDVSENLSLTDDEKTIYVLEKFENVFEFVELLHDDSGVVIGSDVLCGSTDPNFRDRILNIVREYYQKN